MDEDLLRCLLAAFPTPPAASRATPDDGDCLLIRGYRVALESPLSDQMLRRLAEFRSSGLGAGFDRG